MNRESQNHRTVALLLLQGVKDLTYRADPRTQHFILWCVQIDRDQALRIGHHKAVPNLGNSSLKLLVLGLSLLNIQKSRDTWIT